MTNALPRSLDPDVIARISSLEFKARQVVEGLIAGRHRSPFRGGSAEFAQHREYTPGDDLRYLDWKVWARSDRLTVKEFEEETNLRATFLLDASASMDYGSNLAHKYEYSTMLVGSLAYLLLRQSDSVGLKVFDDSLRVEIPHRNVQNHLRALLHGMQVVKPAKKYDFAAIMGEVAEQDFHRGLVVLVSDLLADRESVLDGLRRLRQRRHDVIVFHVLHDDEIDFDFHGTTRFEGLEDPSMITCDPRGLRDDYLKAVNRFLTDVRKLCGRTGIDYRLARTSQPLDAVLGSLLRERMRA